MDQSNVEKKVIKLQCAFRKRLCQKRFKLLLIEKIKYYEQSKEYCKHLNSLNLFFSIFFNPSHDIEIFINCIKGLTPKIIDLETYNNEKCLKLYKYLISHFFLYLNHKDYESKFILVFTLFLNFMVNIFNFSKYRENITQSLIDNEFLTLLSDIWYYKVILKKTLSSLLQNGYIFLLLKLLEVNDFSKGLLDIYLFKIFTLPSLFNFFIIHPYYIKNQHIFISNLNSYINTLEREDLSKLGPNSNLFLLSNLAVFYKSYISSQSEEKNFITTDEVTQIQQPQLFNHITCAIAKGISSKGHVQSQQWHPIFGWTSCAMPDVQAINAIGTDLKHLWSQEFVNALFEPLLSSVDSNVITDYFSIKPEVIPQAYEKLCRLCHMYQQLMSIFPQHKLNITSTFATNYRLIRSLWMFLIDFSDVEASKKFYLNFYRYGGNKYPTATDDFHADDLSAPLLFICDVTSHTFILLDDEELFNSSKGLLFGPGLGNSDNYTAKKCISVISLFLNGIVYALLKKYPNSYSYNNSNNNSTKNTSALLSCNKPDNSNNNNINNTTTHKLNGSGITFDDFAQKIRNPGSILKNRGNFNRKLLGTPSWLSSKCDYNDDEDQVKFSSKSYGHLNARTEQRVREVGDILSSQLYQSCHALLTVLYDRDVKSHFMPSPESWLIKEVKVNQFMSEDCKSLKGIRDDFRPYSLMDLTQTLLLSNGGGPSRSLSSTESARNTVFNDLMLNDDFAEPDDEFAEPDEQDSSTMSMIQRNLASTLLETVKSKEKLSKVYDNEKAFQAVPAKSRIFINNMPHILSQSDRVTLFRRYLALESSKYKRSDFATYIKIRRNNILEDGYIQMMGLSPRRKLKGTIRVRFINSQGLEEPGIDQDGVFKEFLEDVIKKIFYPALNLFQLTDDHKYYLSPTSHLQDDYLGLIEFAGILIGKAVYEGLVIDDIELAPYFLNFIIQQGRKLVSYEDARSTAPQDNDKTDRLLSSPYPKYSSNPHTPALGSTSASKTPVPHTASRDERTENLRMLYSPVDELDEADPVLYKSLKYLKECTSPEEIKDLGLTFATNTDCLGKIETHDLIAGGNNITVTQENKFLYIHLMARYRLHTQIQRQLAAFVKGFYTIIKPGYIVIFSAPELQQIISGEKRELDLRDLRKNTKYYGGFHDKHKVILWLWDILENDLTPPERSRFLKFVTSCSRAPLQGFSHLDPPFAVRCVDVEEEQDNGDTLSSIIQGFFSIRRHSSKFNKARLPTASTCFNLLKLPNYSKKSLLRDKLKYAINSNTGFELS